MRLKKYTEEELRNAVASSFSTRQSLVKLKVAPYGGNYTVFKRALQFFNIDSSHFTGQGWSKNKTLPVRKSLNDYLTSRTTQSNKLRQVLLKEGIFPHQCSNCNLSIWLEKPIPLELDHM